MLGLLVGRLLIAACCMICRYSIYTQHLSWMRISPLSLSIADPMSSMNLRKYEIQGISTVLDLTNLRIHEWSRLKVLVGIVPKLASKSEDFSLQIRDTRAFQTSSLMQSLTCSRHPHVTCHTWCLVQATVIFLYNITDHFHVAQWKSTNSDQSHKVKRSEYSSRNSIISHPRLTAAHIPDMHLPTSTFRVDVQVETRVKRHTFFLR